MELDLINTDKNDLLTLAHFYKTMRNYDEMKKYYRMAIDKGNSDAMLKLGVYYQTIEKDYNIMKKYYRMAIDKENSSAMFNLAVYYQTIEINYNIMEKYYLIDGY